MLYAVAEVIISAAACMGLLAGLWFAQNRQSYAAGLVALSYYLFLLPIAAWWVFITAPGGAQDGAEVVLGLLAWFVAGVVLLAARRGVGHRVVGSASIWALLCIAVALTAIWAVTWTPPCSSPGCEDAGMGYAFLLFFLGAVFGLTYLVVMITWFVQARSIGVVWKPPLLGTVGAGVTTIFLIVRTPRFLASLTGLIEIVAALTIGAALWAVAAWDKNRGAG